ncbi:MAG: Rpn family recombination-promoting nuclease/putative transposase [Thermoguttaceae bacterium]|nr:Rpn family recombination-promoting nuclease/putative transposase [Thermoguttaceae bacterium]
MSARFRAPDYKPTREDVERLHNVFRAFFKKKKPRFLTSAHDAYFFLLLSDRKFAIEFLTTYFPDLAEVLDFDRLSFEMGTRINLLFEKKIADLSFIVPFKERGWENVRIRIIIEHKAQSGSREDRRSLGNIYQYLSLGMTEPLGIGSDKGEEPRAAQSIAVLVYTGRDENYNGPDPKKCFPLPKKLEKYRFGGYIPCVNLTRLYKEGKIKGSPLLRLALSALACGGLRTLGKMFEALMVIYDELKTVDERAKYHLGMFFEYVRAATKNLKQTISRERFLNVMYKMENEEVKSAMEPYGGWFTKEEEKAIYDKGYEGGYDKGYEGGREEWTLRTLGGLVDKGLLPLKQAAAEMGLTVSQFKEKVAALA